MPVALNPPLVSAEWLKANINAPDIRVVDATWVPPFLVGRKSGADQYAEAHIPGAIFFDIDAISDRQSDLPHMLPDPIQFSSQVRKLGLGDGNRIIVYDNNGFFAAARVWWMFRAMGHDEVQVLNGGLSQWLAQGGGTDDLPPHPVERHFTARKRADLIRDVAQIRSASTQSGTTILDARAPGRFAGTAPEPRPELASGHIPGSINLPAGELLASTGLMKDKPALESLLAPYLNKPAIATCGSGVSAAIIALALAQLGHWDVALYDGSWSEWAADAQNPIATGA